MFMQDDEDEGSPLQGGVNRSNSLRPRKSKDQRKPSGRPPPEIFSLHKKSRLQIPRVIKELKWQQVVDISIK